MAKSRKLVPQKVGALDKRRRPRGLTRAIRTAIDAIIFDRCTRLKACEQAGITERALYLALEKAEVAAYWRRQTVVLRTGERAANLHALVSIRDAGKNANASVKAVQVLEQLEHEAVARPVGPTIPGLVIQILNAPVSGGAISPVTIDVQRAAIPETQDEGTTLDLARSGEFGEALVPSRRLAPAGMAPARQQSWER